MVSGSDVRGSRSGGVSLDNVRVVLVETSHPGNIGGAARAMKTMGLSDLVLVNPLRYPDPQADWRAAGAKDLLHSARVCDSLDDAIGDAHLVIGTSARSRRIPWPVVDPRELARRLPGELMVGPRVAVLFGREANGLSNDELHRCNYHVQIPANDAYSSLNLAMAVQVICYEIACAVGGEHLPASERGLGLPEWWDRPAATDAQVRHLLEHLQTVLLDTGFLDAEHPGQTMTRLERLLRRVQLDETEVQMVRGILSHLHSGVRADPAEK